MRHTLRLACPATLTRPSGSKIIPFEPGSGPLNGSVPVYPLGCMKTLAPLPGTHRSMFVCWDLRKQESSFVRPNWAFSPLVEASGYALQLGIRPNQLLESGVELLNVLRQCGHGESRDSHDQEKESVYRDRGHGAAKTTAYWKCVHASSSRLLYCIEQKGLLRPDGLCSVLRDQRESA